MSSNQLFIDRLASKIFGHGGRARRTPHPLFADLYERVRVALDEAELCLHADLTSRANAVDIFFHFETWAQFVATRRVQVEQALETELEEYRREAGYRDEERIVLRLFVADPAQLDVPPNRPEVVARRVPDPLSLDQRWHGALKHTTVVGGVVRETRAQPVRSVSLSPVPAAFSGAFPATVRESSTRATPLARLSFVEDGVEKDAELAAPGVFGRGSGCDVQTAVEIVSRRALGFDVAPLTGSLIVKNLGRWALACGEASLQPEVSVAVEDELTLVWPGDGDEQFVLRVRAPRRGRLMLRRGELEQRVVLRAPRTFVRADRALFGDVDVAFNVDFVDGTRFLVLNNEGAVPLKLGTLEGKQLQWPIDAPRELEAGPIAVAIVLEETP